MALVETHWGVGPTEDRFSEELHACFARWDPQNSKYYFPPTLESLPQRQRELDQSTLFEDVALKRYCVERHYDAARYRDFIATWSSLRVLQPEAREGMLDCVAILIETRFDGLLRRHDAYSLWLARKRAAAP